MIYFEFSSKVISKVISELEKAEVFIRIAIFQLHNKEVFNVLSKKLHEGIKVEIFTLPYDSINENINQEVTKLFEGLVVKGAILHFCKWNIGDPERTTTAVGRWYSFHGKFIVTDKAAIALSANFTQQSELDALLFFEQESEKIFEYNTTFDKLLELFLNPYLGYNGIIRQKIINTGISNVASLFELPRVIDSTIHKNHWIQDYPSVLCPEDTEIKDKLYIVPFDIKGINLIMKLILEAHEYVYISTESFTDPNFSDFLIKCRLRNIDLRILTGATSMDFSDRVQKMLREMLSCEIKIRTIEEDLHAKLIITEKHVAVGSINLNKMNLGFKRSSQLWRENTESITICSNSDIISNAKYQYLGVFDKSVDISLILAQKIENRVGKLLNSLFGLSSSNEVKILFAKLILHQEIQTKKIVITVGKITANLMKLFNKNKVKKEHFLMALILYYLSERKHDFNQLDEKLKILETELDLQKLLYILHVSKLIEKQEDFYKLSVETLFKEY